MTEITQDRIAEMRTELASWRQRQINVDSQWWEADYEEWFEVFDAVVTQRDRLADVLERIKSEAAASWIADLATEALAEVRKT